MTGADAPFSRDWLGTNQEPAGGGASSASPRLDYDDGVAVGSDAGVATGVGPGVGVDVDPGAA